MNLDQQQPSKRLMSSQLAQLQRLALNPAQIEAERVLLSGNQHHYLCRVLRLTVGDRFIAIDGRGRWWLAELAAPDRPGDRTAQLLGQISVQHELPVTLRLVIALPKGNGFDEVVRQATELGVGEIWPVISDRTLLRPSAQKCDRWRRIAQEAAEQAERQLVPLIYPPQPWPAFLSQDAGLDQSAESDRPQTNLRYICVTRQPAPMLLKAIQKPIFNYSGSTVPKITLATGPEGGWTEAEIHQAIAIGFQPVSLGKRVLRAVTAPIAALAMLMATVEWDEPEPLNSHA